MLVVLCFSSTVDASFSLFFSTPAHFWKPVGYFPFRVKALTNC